MRIDAWRSIGSVDPRLVYQDHQQPEAKSNFAQTLQSALNEINSLQAQRDEMVENMISGQVSEVHDVMTAAEAAQLAFELLLDTRNRLLEAYQEIMRMQI